MATPSPTPITPIAKKDRKVSVRIPRTPAEVAMGQCNAILKKLPTDELRARVMKSLVALHGAG
jgi:hypothetical protein